MSTDSIDIQEMLVDSRASHYPWYDRIDPLHEIGYKDSLDLHWETPSVYRRKYDINMEGFVAEKWMEYYSPVFMSKRALYSPRPILAMACLYQFHHLTTFQLCALLGESRRSVWNSMSNLFAAGVVRRSVPGWWQSNNDYGGTGSIWAVNYKTAEFERWLSGLTDMEYALLTGGTDPEDPPSGVHSVTTIRHNLITSDLCIRAMEACPSIVGAWGDRFCSADMLYRPHHQSSDHERRRSNIGDAVLVDRNGGLIVLEVVGSGSISNDKSGQRLSDKAGAWVSIAARSDLDVKVIFVSSNQRDKFRIIHRFVRQGIEHTSKEHIIDSVLRKKGQDRIYVASAHEWFPFPTGIAAEFRTLNSYSPFRDEWVDVIPGKDSMDLRGALDKDNPVLTNTLTSLHTPEWAGVDVSDH